MSYTYESRKKVTNTPGKESAAQTPSMEALMQGAAAPTQEQMGHRVDLPEAMREKMENAFGADLSSVKLYESETVGNAGAAAITQGSNIAFAPGMLDFTSYEGQARLGHEISHVVSQTRGEVTGTGFLNDHSLEARADREGAMAASGQQIAMPVSAMSSASAAPAAGPMQAMKVSNKVKKMKSIAEVRATRDNVVSDEDEQWYDYQMSHMDKKTLDEINRQQTKASKGLIDSYNKKVKGGMNAGEAATRTHFSGAGDDVQAYESLLREYAFGYDNTGGGFVKYLNDSLSQKDKAIRQGAKGIASDAVDSDFYKSDAGTDFRNSEQLERENRILSRYRNR